MSDVAVASVRPIVLPNVSFGPYRLMEAVPWLMFATAMRIFESSNWGQWLVAAGLANLSIFLAFLLAARRMVEFTNGKTGLGRLDFRAQLTLARIVLIPIFAFVVVGSIVVFRLGARWTGMYFLLGFDGIAFDQYTYPCMAWSAFLAALLLLTVLKAESTGSVGLFSIFIEFGQRAACMVPAIVAVTIADIGLNAIQGAVRHLVVVFWHTSALPLTAKNLVYFLFIFSFASVRLWLTLAILTFALRDSYRRGHAMPHFVPDRFKTGA